MFFNSHPSGGSRPDLSPVCQQTMYVIGTVNTNSCPKGSYGIEDVTGCQTAAAALGKPRKWQHADSWSHLPTGCSVHDNGDMFFNSHPSGGSRPDLSPVCQQTMYVIGTVNTNSCPKGSSGIEDVTGCQTAAAALGKPWEWQHADSWSHLPTGCSVHDNGDMFFNSHPSGGSRPDLSPVCLM